MNTRTIQSAVESLPPYGKRIPQLHAGHIIVAIDGVPVGEPVLVTDVTYSEEGDLLVVDLEGQDMPGFILDDSSVEVLEPIQPEPGQGGQWKGCSTCYSIGGGFGPRHQPSSMCRSGKRPHCTCDACF